MYIATKVQPEYQDSEFEWFADDEFRKWSIVQHERGIFYYKFCIDDVRLVIEMLEFIEYYDSSDDAIDVCRVRLERMLKEHHKEQEFDDIIDDIKVCFGEFLKKEHDYLSYIETAAELLTIIRGEVFVATNIKGCCQGDYEDVIIPKSMLDTDYLEELEARYFNIGDEWRVIGGDDDDFVYTAYTWKYSDDEILQQISEQCDISLDKLTLQD